MQCSDKTKCLFGFAPSLIDWLVVLAIIHYKTVNLFGDIGTTDLQLWLVVSVYILFRFVFYCGLGANARRLSLCLMIALACIIETVLGISQVLTNYCYSGVSVCVGTFCNPGLLGGFLSACLLLNVDQYGYEVTQQAQTISYGAGDSPLTIKAVNTGAALPQLPQPIIKNRIGLDINCIDLQNEQDANWLQALIWRPQIQCQPPHLCLPRYRIVNRYDIKKRAAHQGLLFFYYTATQHNPVCMKTDAQFKQGVSHINKWVLRIQRKHEEYSYIASLRFNLTVVENNGYLLLQAIKVN